MHILVKSPLGKMSSGKSTDAITNIIQNLCISYHITCTNIIVRQDNTVLITLDPDQQIIFSLQKNLKIQFASLQLTIHAFTIEGKRLRRLDFRFDKPVISD